MFLGNILSGAHRLLAKSVIPIPYHAVIDHGDETLVALSTNLPALILLNDSMMDTSYVPDIVSPDISTILASGPRSYPEWSWDSGRREFKKTNPINVTENARERAVLVDKKVGAITRVMYTINSQRARINSGFFFQDNIYAEKERQALLLKEGNFNEKLAPEIPYVVQYASDSEIPLKQAAEEIMLRAKLDHEYLAKTEKTRLALLKKIRLAKKPEEVEAIIQNYRKTGAI